MAPIWKHNFKVNMKVLRRKYNPFNTNMTKYQTLHELIYQCGWFFYDNVWLKCNVYIKKTFESDTANIIISDSHKYFKQNQGGIFYHIYYHWKLTVNTSLYERIGIILSKQNHSIYFWQDFVEYIYLFKYSSNEYIFYLHYLYILWRALLSKATSNEWYMIILKWLTNISKFTLIPIHNVTGWIKWLNIIYSAVHWTYL